MENQTASVRPAAVAGMFYPGEPERLRGEVDTLLAQATARAKALPKMTPKALIVPHAGYAYSGPIAATAYAHLKQALQDSPCPISRLILIGPAHRVYVPGLASAGAAGFLTPLGGVDVDAEWLERVPEVPASPRAHSREHCLEVQIPFLQRILPEARIVPLLCSDAPPEQVGEVLERLWGGPETRVLVSSDLSHYLPYETARAVDEETAERVLSLRPSLDGERACGCAAINGLLWVARRKGISARLLDLRNSGDTAGSRQEVVGYSAFSFYEGGT
jgi:hypothetical protein